MEDRQSHPIPQDVTGFQFRLIGDMTIKQFAYLAGPIFLAWIFFQLPLPLLIKIPVSLVLGGLGASLAFLPVAGRPMDVMITNFVKALFRSTVYIYQKKGMQNLMPAAALNTQKINIQKSGVQTQQLNKEPIMSRVRPILQTAPQIMTMYSPTTTQAIPKNLPPQQVSKKYQPQGDKSEGFAKTPPVLEKKQQLPKKQEKTMVESSDLQKQLQAALNQKEELTKQLMALQQKLDTKKENFFSPTLAKAAPTEKAKPRPQTENVRQVPKALGKSVGLPIAPEAPNIVTGIIKDPRGNPLGNILVEIKDIEGNPVRAFKTNGLGQFASATPLTNGNYTISFEDPKGQNKFDAIEFTAKNEIILPFEVISIDTREELRKTLFKES